MIFHEVVYVTPAFAKAYLETSKGNRSIHRVTANMYARDMAAGKWLLNGEPIIFGEDGELLDGHHRLYGVIASGATVPMLIVRGISRDSFHSIDTGKKRSPGDILTINNVTNATTVAAASVLVMVYQAGKFSGKSWVRPSTRAVVEFASKHPGIVDSAAFAKAARHICSPPALAAAHYILSAIDEVGAYNFLDRVRQGDGHFPGEPEYVLRETLLKQRVGYRTAKSEVTLAIIIKGWNAYRTDRQPQRLRFLAGEVYPVAA